MDGLEDNEVVEEVIEAEVELVIDEDIEDVIESEVEAPVEVVEESIPVLDEVETTPEPVVEDEPDTLFQDVTGELLNYINLADELQSKVDSMEQVVTELADDNEYQANRADEALISEDELNEQISDLRDQVTELQTTIDSSPTTVEVPVVVEVEVPKRKRECGMSTGSIYS